MKTINLLPQWYTQQAHRNRRMRMHIVAMICLGGLMYGATQIGGRVRDADFKQRDDLARQLESIPDLSAELRVAQADLHRLEERQLARKELGHTVPMSKVIQQLQNHMSPGMALSNVSIDVRSEPIKGTGFVGDPHNPPKYHDVARVNVQGIAPTDRRITDFIDDISLNPLFAGVTLDFTRGSMLQNYPVRKFELQMDMDLERLTTGDAGDAVASAESSESAAGVSHE
jgi:Tfp pilus assembly protein PilN